MKKILLIGYYGYGNLGDELMRKSIKEFLIKENFEILELLPKSEKHDNSFKRFNFFSIIKALIKSDIVICGGGGILQDKTSLKSFLYYYFVFELSAFLGKPLIFFGNSFGPFKRYLSRKLFRNLLKNKKLYIFARDEISYNYVKRCNVKSYLGTDPAINFLKNVEIKPKKNGQVVIIPRKFKSYVPILLNLANQGFSEVVFVPFSPEDIPLAKKMSNFSVKGLKLSYISQIENAIEYIQQSEMVISERFHGSLIASYFGVPFVSIKDEKFRRFFHKYIKNYEGYAKDIVEASYKISIIKDYKIEVKEKMERDMEEMYEKLKKLVHNLT